jgi:hypothetical protein
MRITGTYPHVTNECGDIVLTVNVRDKMVYCDLDVDDALKLIEEIVHAVTRVRRVDNA